MTCDDVITWSCLGGDSNLLFHSGFDTGDVFDVYTGDGMEGGFTQRTSTHVNFMIGMTMIIVMMIGMRTIVVMMYSLGCLLTPHSDAYEAVGVVTTIDDSSLCDLLLTDRAIVQFFFLFLPSFLFLFLFLLSIVLFLLLLFYLLLLLQLHSRCRRQQKIQFIL